MLQWAFEPADETIVAAMIDKGAPLLNQKPYCCLAGQACQHHSIFGRG